MTIKIKFKITIQTISPYLRPFLSFEHISDWSDVFRRSITWILLFNMNLMIIFVQKVLYFLYIKPLSHFVQKK